MSQSNVAKLRELVTKDPELQKRLESTQGEGAFASALVGMGAEKGLPFTTADLDAWKSGEGASIELNEEQLQTVAGGATAIKTKTGYTSYGNSTLCVFCSGGSYSQ